MQLYAALFRLCLRSSDPSAVRGGDDFPLMAFDPEDDACGILGTKSAYTEVQCDLGVNGSTKCDRWYYRGNSSERKAPIVLMPKSSSIDTLQVMNSAKRPFRSSVEEPPRRRPSILSLFNCSGRSVPGLVREIKLHLFMLLCM